MAAGDIWPRDRLAAGSGVVDVAGGQGNLSWELVNLNGVNTTVVDPRPSMKVRFERQWAYFNGKSQRETDDAVASVPAPAT